MQSTWLVIINNIFVVLLLFTKGPAKPKTYYIAHEILTTERTFVDALKLVFEVGEELIRSMVLNKIITAKCNDFIIIQLKSSHWLRHHATCFSEDT